MDPKDNQIKIIWPQLKRGIEVLSVDGNVKLEKNVVSISLENVGATAVVINKVFPLAVGSGALEFNGTISGGGNKELIVTRTIDDLNVAFDGGTGQLMVIKTYFEGVNITYCDY